MIYNSFDTYTYEMSEAIKNGWVDKDISYKEFCKWKNALPRNNSNSEDKETHPKD